MIVVARPTGWTRLPPRRRGPVRAHHGPMVTDPHRDDDLARCQLILDTLAGPRVIYRGGEPRVDLSSFDRPFAPAVDQAGSSNLVARRRAS